MGSIHPTVSEICVPQSLDPICAKFDKFLAHGQAHMGQMGKWTWQCTTTGLDNSIELRMVQIHPAVSEIWVPQSLSQVLPDLTSFWPIRKPIRGKWANDYDSAQLQVQTSPWNFKWGQSIQRFQRYAFRKVWTQFVPNLTSFWPMGKPIWGKWANEHDSAQLQA